MVGMRSARTAECNWDFCLCLSRRLFVSLVTHQIGNMCARGRVSCPRFTLNDTPLRPRRRGHRKRLKVIGQ
ncbi:hypothetical protein EYF80_038893 [Liparis tanakae]|uniref:Uncharacterized protein n=1 Tax=Liparis tanakae TaxID=230148 RepID=A0A4Z2GE11_9TELE|nr:hypothetical protein EYF80_038893 [Liparis tanakae]